MKPVLPCITLAFLIFHLISIRLGGAVLRLSDRVGVTDVGGVVGVVLVAKGGAFGGVRLHRDLRALGLSL